MNVMGAAEVAKRHPIATRSCNALHVIGLFVKIAELQRGCVQIDLVLRGQTLNTKIGSSTVVYWITHYF